MNAQFQKGWYVLYVKSRHEKKVNDLLVKFDFESYLPMVGKMKKWSDRKKLIFTPLFRSYVFVYINRQDDFSRVLSLEGACAFINFSGEFARVKDEEIKNIKMLLSGKYDNIELTTPLPKVGEMKTIKHGLLKGEKCRVVKVNNEFKILVRVDSIHIHILATLPVEHLGSVRAMY